MTAADTASQNSVIASRHREMSSEAACSRLASGDQSRQAVQAAHAPSQYKRRLLGRLRRIHLHDDA
jgi:hypothetical protein